MQTIKYLGILKKKTLICLPMAWTQSTPRRHLPSEMKVSPESPGKAPLAELAVDGVSAPFSLLARSPPKFGDCCLPLPCQVPRPLTKEKEKLFPRYPVWFKTKHVSSFPFALRCFLKARELRNTDILWKLRAHTHSFACGPLQWASSYRRDHIGKGWHHSYSHFAHKEMEGPRVWEICSVASNGETGPVFHTKRALVAWFLLTQHEAYLRVPVRVSAEFAKMLVGWSWVWHTCHHF